MSNWNSACLGCGVHPSMCRCPKPESLEAMRPVMPGDASESDYVRVQKARRDFARRVEQAIESGDTSEIEARIGRFIRET